MKRISFAIAMVFGAVSFALACASLAGRLFPLGDAVASFVPFAPIFGALMLVAVLRRKGRWWRVAGLTAVLLPIALMAPEWLVSNNAGQADEIGQGEEIVVLTHNLAVANHDPERTLALLRSSGADILLLQEARGKMRPLLASLRRDYPYGSQCPTGCDIAILSRLPMSRVRWRLRDAAGRPFGPPLMWAQVYPGEERAFTVMSVHMPWPLPGEEQAIRRAALVEALARIDRRSVILAGDFNLTPWAPGMRELERGLSPMRRITRGQWSFPARLPGGAIWPVPFLPIDHVFVGREWLAEATERLERTGSDHVALRVVFRRRQAARR